MLLPGVFFFFLPGRLAVYGVGWLFHFSTRGTFFLIASFALSHLNFDEFMSPRLP
jgi:hypothetical protein